MGILGSGFAILSLKKEGSTAPEQTFLLYAVSIVQQSTIN